MCGTSSSLKSTGSEFKGFLKDKYTTLQETDDRIMATALTARWRYDAQRSSTGTRRTTTSGARCSRSSPTPTAWRCSRRSTRWARRVLEACPEIAEIKFSTPNKHHFLVDLTPFGLENPNEVFIAADRPYGLIEASVVREGGSDPGDAWLNTPGFC